MNDPIDIVEELTRPTEEIIEESQPDPAEEVEFEPVENPAEFGEDPGPSEDEPMFADLANDPEELAELLVGGVDTLQQFGLTRVHMKRFRKRSGLTMAALHALEAKMKGAEEVSYSEAEQSAINRLVATEEKVKDLPFSDAETGQLTKATAKVLALHQVQASPWGALIFVVFLLALPRVLDVLVD